ncbi:MAG: hydantoinase B/oxoprolinase family protein, partial [Sphingomonadales bacterium]
EDVFLDKIARGFLDVANEHMSRAIKKISVERGHNITKHTLISFGGAGGQHALGVAELLGITQVYIHPLAGVLSALGIGLAVITEIKELPINLPLSKHSLENIKRHLKKLSHDAGTAIQEQGVKGGSVNIRQHLHLKYYGSDTTLLIPYGKDEYLRKGFEEEHKRLFGFIESDKKIIIEAAQVEAFGDTPKSPNFTQTTKRKSETLIDIEICIEGVWTKAPLYHRDEIKVGKTLAGPALVIEDLGTNVLEKGWTLTKDDKGGLLFNRVENNLSKEVSAELDPILLEIFNNRFMGIAEEMGAILENTAHSINMKERLDFSCAVFDRGGELVANAPHMPVHLGSMGESVKVAATRNKGLFNEGDVIMINDPYNGGTHLPDITVVTPVFIEGQSGPQFFVASRGHHADIGGISPGSMPPHSKTLDEEGVLFNNIFLVKDGKFLEKDVTHLLKSALYPARNPTQNIADLKAQVASLEKGVTEVRKMTEEFGFSVTKAYMQFIQDNAEESVRHVLEMLEEGNITFPMDGGAIIKIKITPDPKTRTATIDFTGSSPQTTSNINAPKSITMAAILYVFRTLVDDEIPLNAGCLKPLNIIVPKGIFLNPEYPAAVVAGNVETSQAITNALFLAIKKLASSQGTMNNLTFGTKDYQYYETIAGGNGAGFGISGGHSTQVHMTNSKMTDPEVFEARYPVILENHSRRVGSGGKGKWFGGDGTTRRIRFLEDMDLAVLSNHRKNGPPGLMGGDAGKVGVNTLFRKSGHIETLGGSDSAKVFSGDIIEIKTPGGGGYGRK